MAAATQMLAGGAILIVAATVTGEWSRLDLASISGRSLWALIYLAVFGSIVAHSAYVYLLRVQTAAAVSTYAFVNPVIALALGWLAGEALGSRALVGATLVASAVVLIHWARRQPVPRSHEPRAEMVPAELVAGACAEGATKS